MRVFLDANILFSAVLTGSRTRGFLNVLFEHAACVTNGYAVEEARRNLELRSPTALSGLMALVRECEIVEPSLIDSGVELKEKDRPILSGAIAAKATHLVTGDKRDFGHLYGNSVKGVKIVSPLMLAQELVKLGWIAA